MKTLFKLVFVLSTFLIFETLHGQIVTDRPDQTEASSTVGRGDLQLETGLLIGFSGDESSRQILAPTTLFRFGITEEIELRLLSQFETQKNTLTNVQGISDLEIGTKIQLLKKEDIYTEIAFLSHLILPTGTKELSNDEFGTINKLAISHSINENTGIGYNIGYNHFGTGDGDFTYSLALGVGVTEKVGVYIEPFGELVNLQDHNASFDAGVTYLLNDHLQFDFSFGTGLNHPMNYISFGLSWLAERVD